MISWVRLHQWRTLLLEPLDVDLDVARLLELAERTLLNISSDGADNEALYCVWNDWAVQRPGLPVQICKRHLQNLQTVHKILFKKLQFTLYCIFSLAKMVTSSKLSFEKKTFDPELNHDF